MEPSDDDYDRTHLLFDCKGELVEPLVLSSFSISKLSAPPSSSSSWIHSVLLADGIHHQIDSEDLEDLPQRFEPGSSKAKLTWFGTLCLAGMGMFIEAYVIITIGQIKTLWSDQYPECFEPTKKVACPNDIDCCGLFPNTPLLDNGTCIPQVPAICNPDGTYPSNVLCNKQVLESISYSEFAGIMAGMLVFGYLADLIGRNRAGTITAVLMVTGISVMTFTRLPSTNTQFLIFSIFFGIFGLGVGGEYPLTASGAAAHHVVTAEEAEWDDDERRRRRILRDHERTARRGETIGIVFAMQGVGAVVGSLTLVMLIYFAQQGQVNCDENTNPGANPTGTEPRALDSVWRSFFLIGGLLTVMVLVYRWLIVEEGGGHAKLLERKAKRQARLGGKVVSTLRILKFYAPRLLGTGGNWFVWDVAFYGLRLFSGPIFESINPNGNLIVTNGYLVINCICSLVGYYSAALVIDYPFIGRRRFQMCSFVIQAILFFVSAAILNNTEPNVLMTLFFLSSYFGNFGSNVTTYVMAAESYPTELRGTCHGISAFAGKIGALIATVVFSHISTVEIFYICAGTSLAGLVFTFVFSVDLTRVSLAEHDAQLELFLEGRPEAYKGKLNAYPHLSNWEYWTGRHGEYEPGWAAKLVKEEKLKQGSKASESVRASLDAADKIIGPESPSDSEGKSLISGGF